MMAVANNPAFAKKVGIKQSVGQDFAAADKGKTFKGGGMAKKMTEKEWEGSKEDLDQDKKLAKKHNMTFSAWEKSKMDEKHDKQQSMKGLKMGGKINKIGAGKAMPDATKMGPLGLKKGGSIGMPRTMAGDVEKGSNQLRKFGEAKVQKREATKGRNLGDSGPSVGIETGGMKKGGKVKKMCGGGMSKTKKYASGGSIDGIAVRGKTKCKDFRG